MEDSSLERLSRALQRFPLDRYPVKHASIQRRLGAALAAEARWDEAARAFGLALGAYGEDLPVERAETLNILGAVLRELGDLDRAAASFREAISLLEGADAGARAGFAWHNLGLVLRDQGETSTALLAFRSAAALFPPSDQPAGLAATLRELGSSLLEQGELVPALPLLERAVHLAAAGGDRVGLGAATNVLGLIKLAMGDGDGAVAAFTESASAHPLSLRPAAHAMAKANLALAEETTGDKDRARQSAHHALSISESPEAVVAQAKAVLDRLGTAYDLHRILDELPEGRWEGMLREEIGHWARVAEEDRAELAGSWISGQERRRAGAERRQEALFAAMLELPPAAFDLVAASLVETALSLEEGTRAWFFDLCSRAAARFHIPQMSRLEVALTRGRRSG